MTALLALLACLLTTTVTPSTDPGVPASAELILDGSDPASLVGPGWAEGATLAVVDGAARVDVPAVTDPVWAAQLESPKTTAAIERGDVLFGYFDVRATSGRESGGGLFTAWVQSPDGGVPGGPWTEVRKLGGAPGATFTRRYWTTTSPQDFPAGSVSVVFHLGVAAQQIDVKNVMIYNLGPDFDVSTLPTTELTYEGREPDAAWRAEAERRIEAHRKADLTVAVTEGGEPVAGREVRFELIDHAFEFGTFVENDPPLLKDTPDGREHARVVGDYFNTITAPGFAADTWGFPDPTTRERYGRIIEWAQEHGKTVKVTPLVWSRFDYSPSAWRSLDGPALREAIDTYIRDVLAELGEREIDILEVHNEPRGFQQFEQVIGEKRIGHEWFKTAREVAPSIGTLTINEHTILSGAGVNRASHDHYFDTIRAYLDAGAPVGAIGFQGHIGEDFTPPTRVWEVMDRFAEFGLPLHVTEFDVSTGDEAVQADYVRDFATAVFAHPAAEALILWGFWEGQMWIPQAALWREDWTPKPAGEAWMTLMTETWHTDEAATTDRSGEATVRVFKGTLRVTVDDITREVEVDDNTSLTIELD